MTETAVSSAPALAEIKAAISIDRSRAIDLAIRALGDGLEDPLIMRLVAEGLAEDRRWQDAAALLHAANVKTPGDVEVLTDFGRMLVKLRRLDEAMTAFDEALAIAPDSYGAHMGAGSTCLIRNRPAEAGEHFRRAAAIMPDAAEPISALAAVAVREDDPIQARALAARALAIRPDLIRAQAAIAEADLAEGEPGLAETRLKRLLARRDLDDDQRAGALTFLADALDALDRPAEAFAFYGTRNTALRRLFEPTLEATVPERRIDHARRLTAWFEAAPPAPWREAAGEDRRGAQAVRRHVFLMGFPRSGTTLLETVLASHPDVVAMEEKIFLNQAAGDFLADDDGLRRLANLGAAEADIRRGAYWDQVREFFAEDISGKVLIDKLPLHTVTLPAIAKLFPRAKILFARRDPRDVVLSCFRQHFRLNAAMYEFLTLDSAAAYYDQIMKLADIYRAKLPLDIHDLRHEDLVADFEGVTGEALRFIGLDWDPAVHAFPARARALSSTPSAPQVARGLNAKGVGQWRRYRRWLAPVLATLEPWAARFGYEPIDSRDLPAALDPRLAAILPRIGAATRVGDWARAFAEVDAAFGQGLDHPQLHRLRGVRGQRDGRLDEAIADFEAALADAPGDFSLLSAIGLCLARGGRYDEALARLDTAIAIEPGLAAAHFNRGWTLESLGDFSGARQAYERAIAIEPGHTQALGTLSSLACRAGDWARARETAQRALAIDPEQPMALTALAEAEAAQGEPAAAERRLRGLIADSPRTSPHERALAQTALGDLFDRLERPADAFGAYEAAGEQFKSLHGARYGGSGMETSLSAARRLAAYFAAADRADWRRAPVPAQPNAAKGHIFLIGFPRSGTTMLGQALAGHGDAVTLDERDTLGEATREFMGRPQDLGRLAVIGRDDIERHRALYWANVTAAGAGVAGRVFIDKQPMNSLALPMVVKLFPDAKVIFLRRDPRDVVLSAFRRQFAVNQTTVELMTPLGAATLYDAVMRLMEIYQSKLDLDLRVQSYEALVEDFDGETRALCDFVGLDWRPGLANFAGRAGAVATPSAAQLARGLNAESVGRWRAYRDELAPVLPILAPWVSRFGYDSRARE